MDNKSDKLYYFSKSRNELPGKGINEYITKLSDYKDLSKIENWRRILSNFHTSPFVYNDKKYNSVEHAFQASKINIASPKIAKTFEIDSKSELGLGDGLMARKARKIVVLNKKNIEDWDKIKHETMINIWRAKYAQCEISKKVLLATNNAELWHGMMRSRPIRQIGLELVREEIKKNIK